MDWTPIFGFLTGLGGVAYWILFALGLLTFLGTIIDNAIDDEKDHGFMKKAYELPVIGTFLKACKAFFMNALGSGKIGPAVKTIRRFSPTNFDR
jgi:hypothetical protein